MRFSFLSFKERNKFPDLYFELGLKAYFSHQNITKIRSRYKVYNFSSHF